MRPAYTREGIERICHEVRYEAKRQHVVFSLSNEILPGFFSCFGIFLSMTHLKVAIEDQEAWRHCDQQQGEEEVLDEEGDELTRAHTFFFDE